MTRSTLPATRTSANSVIARTITLALQSGGDYIKSKRALEWHRELTATHARDLSETSTSRTRSARLWCGLLHLWWRSTGSIGRRCRDLNLDILSNVSFASIVKSCTYGRLASYLTLSKVSKR
jgi:hypothetical protein